MPTKNVFGADNQQETSIDSFYYSGFCVGEFSCSILKLSNRKSKNGGIYYTPDITISNADLPLLKEVNSRIADGSGVVSRIKGGFNLSIRGKQKVKKVLTFFSKFPPIVGDIAQTKLFILRKALSILERQKGNYRRSIITQKQIEECRELLKELKKTAQPFKVFPQRIFNPEAVGHFLAGVLDAEGSVGIKNNGSKFQPFVAVAMKDRKIVELFKIFLGLGHIHVRPKENIYHFESGSKSAVLQILYLFSEFYPVRLPKMKLRMEKVRRILNDYTPKSQRHVGTMI